MDVFSDGAVMLDKEKIGKYIKGSHDYIKANKGDVVQLAHYPDKNWRFLYKVDSSTAAYIKLRRDLDKCLEDLHELKYPKPAAKGKGKKRTEQAE